MSILKLRKRIRTDFVRRAHVKMAIASVPVATLAEVSAAIDSGDISRGTIASDDVDNSRSEANESVNWTTSSGPPISGPLHGASLFSLSFPPPRSASVSVKLRRKHFSIRREEKRLNSNEYIDRLRRSSGSGRSSGGHPRSSFLLYNRRRNNILHNRRGEERDTMIPWRERSPLSIDGPESCRF